MKTIVFVLVQVVAWGRTLASPLNEPRNSPPSPPPRSACGDVAPPAPGVCLTEQCLKMALDMLTKVDANVDPCGDFFSFACGRWQRRNAHQVNGDNLFFAANLNEMPAAIDGILEDLVKQKRKIYASFYETKPFKDLNTLYTSCMDTDTIIEHGYEPALQVLRGLKSFQIGRPFQEEKWNLTAAILELMNLNGSPFFHITLDTSLNDSTKWIPVLTKPKHYGLIPNELISSGNGFLFRKVLAPGGSSMSKKKVVPASGAQFRKKMLNKNKRLKTIEMLRAMKKTIEVMGYENFISHFVEKFENPESRKNIFDHLRDGKKKNKIQRVMKGKTSQRHGKPNHSTSFFSRIVASDSVVDGNQIDFNALKDNAEHTKNNKKENEPRNRNRVVNFDLTGEVVPPKPIATKQPVATESSGQEEDTGQPPETGTKVPSEVTETPLPFNISISTVEVNFNFTDEEKKLLIEAVTAIYENEQNNGSDPSGGMEDEEALDYKLLVEAAETTFNFLNTIGVTPHIARKDLYTAIFDSIAQKRTTDLELLLEKLHQKGIFVYDNQIYNSATENYTDSATVGPYDSANEIVEDESAVNFTEAVIREANVTFHVMELIQRLAKIEPTPRQEITAIQEGTIFNVFSIEHVQRNYPAIEWEVILHSLLKGDFPPQQEVMIPFIPFFDELFTILQETSPRIVHHALVTLFTFDVLRELVTVTEEEMTREDFCLEVTKETMKVPLSHMYLKHLGDDAIKDLRNNIQPLISSLRAKAKQELLSASSFLTESDKAHAALKVDSMKWEIGGLDDLYDLDYVIKHHEHLAFSPTNPHFLGHVLELYRESNRRDYLVYAEPFDHSKHLWSYTAQPYTINAFYVQSTNSIVVPEAFFQAPYYYPGVPSYVTFGSVGMAFVHEVIHGFDFTGSRFDHTGARTFPFSTSMRSTMRTKLDCYNEMVTQVFSKIEDVEDFKVLMTVDNSATINENLADVVGLDFAYKAYFDHYRSLDEDEPLLPGIPYTKNQIFFLSFAQPYCALIPGVAKTILMEVDEHLPNDIRINGVLINYPPFSEAFSCSPEDKMAAGNLHPTCPMF